MSNNIKFNIRNNEMGKVKSFLSKHHFSLIETDYVGGYLKTHMGILDNDFKFTNNIVTISISYNNSLVVIEGRLEDKMKRELERLLC